MKVRRLGVVFVITIAFVLAGSLSVWSGTPKEEREGYKKEVLEKLKTLDQKIDELKGKAVELKGKVKAEFNKEMTDLRKKQKAAKGDGRKESVAGGS